MCYLDLDADLRYPMAREVFRLQDVAIIGRGIVTTCLRNERQIAEDMLGETGHVVGKIVRSDSPVLLHGTRKERMETYTVPRFGVLLIASRGSADNGSLDDLS